MRKLGILLFFLWFNLMATSAYALLNLELTRGVAGALPIAIVPFAVQGETPSQDVSEIVSRDLQMSGRFKVSGRNKLNEFPDDVKSVNFDYFSKLGVDNVVVGKVQQVGGNRYEVSFQLVDVARGKSSPEARAQAVQFTYKHTVSGDQLRSLAHHISDMIYKQITGVPGVFSTRLAYIVVQRPQNQPARYLLEVSDIDGYNPRVLLTSRDPIMSPAWSPNGRKLAYVSFEKKHAAIFTHEIATGRRELISEFAGINGAPAWSPDGQKMALVLSKGGSPNIYILNIATKQLTPVTKDWSTNSINTEPAWSPKNKDILIFTSNRGGSPQIYQKNLSTGAVTRVTYEGSYNARASFAPDGNHIVVLNKQSNTYNIGVLDLNTGIFRVLTTSGADNESPSIAPNSSMVLYGTLYQGRGVLGLVATDGSVELRMPARDGEVQDPAWSPFLT